MYKNAYKNKFNTPRFFDWTIRWVEFMKDSKDLSKELSLEWDGVTCGSWAGDGVEAITGVDPYEEFRDAFTSPMGAAKAIMKAGYKNIVELMDDRFQKIPVGMAQSGDLLLLPLAHWTADLQTESASQEIQAVMNMAIGLADPPFYWAVSNEGLGYGDLYSDGILAYRVGERI